MAESELKEAREDASEFIYNYLKNANLEAKAIAVGFLNGFTLAEMCQRIKTQNE